MKKCENCKNCPLLKETNKVLLKVFMFNDGSHHFDNCVSGNSIMEDNENPNIKCFIRHSYQNLNINWDAVKNFYEENKDAFRNVGIE